MACDTARTGLGSYQAQSDYGNGDNLGNCDCVDWRRALESCLSDDLGKNLCPRKVSDAVSGISSVNTPVSVFHILNILKLPFQSTEATIREERGKTNVNRLWLGRV